MQRTTRRRLGSVRRPPWPSIVASAALLVLAVAAIAGGGPTPRAPLSFWLAADPQDGDVPFAGAEGRERFAVFEVVRQSEGQVTLRPRSFVDRRIDPARAWLHAHLGVGAPVPPPPPVYLPWPGAGLARTEWVTDVELEMRVRRLHAELDARAEGLWREQEEVARERRAAERRAREASDSAWEELQREIEARERLRRTSSENSEPWVGWQCGTPAFDDDVDVR